MSDAIAVRPVIVVPVKRLADAKSRLASELDPPARNELVVAMLEDVLTAVRAAYDGPVMVLSPSDEYAEVARPFEAGWERDAGTGYNEAIRHAASTSVAASSGAMLVLPGDLPGAQPEDVRQLTGALNRASVVVATAVDGGTAALGLRPAGVIAPAFGFDSARRHQEAALAAAAPLEVVEAASLAYDIDRLGMLTDAPLAFTPGAATRRFLERYRALFERLAEGGQR